MVKRLFMVLPSYILMGLLGVTWRTIDQTSDGLDGMSHSNWPFMKCYKVKKRNYFWSGTMLEA